MEQESDGMSEVLIKGMEMPKACWECPLKVHLFQQLWCTPSNKVIDREDNTEREPDCPLVEVPPHGDLVDKDKLMQEFMDSDLDHLQRDDWKEVIQIVSDADVVIEAEGET